MNPDLRSDLPWPGRRNYGALQRLMQAHLSTRILVTLGIVYLLLAIAISTFTGALLFRAMMRTHTAELLGLVMGADSQVSFLASTGDETAVQNFLNALVQIDWVEYAFYEGPKGRVIATESPNSEEVKNALKSAGIGMSGQSTGSVGGFRWSVLFRRLRHDLAGKGISMVGLNLLGQRVYDLSQLQPSGSDEFHVGISQPPGVRLLSARIIVQTITVFVLFGIAYLLTWFLVRRSAKPLVLLAREVRHIDEREVTSEGRQTGDELSLLARTVRAVAMELQVANRKLDESTTSVEVTSQALEYARAHIRAISSLVRDGFLIADRSGVITEVTPLLPTLLGLSGDGMTGVACDLSPAAALSSLVVQGLDRPYYRPTSWVALPGGRQGIGVAAALFQEEAPSDQPPSPEGVVVRLTDATVQVTLEERQLGLLREVDRHLRPLLNELIEDGRRGLDLVMREWIPRWGGRIAPVKECVRLFEEDLAQLVGLCGQLLRGLQGASTLSSIRANRVEWRQEPFFITHVMNRVAAEVERQMATHDVQFFSRIEEGLPQFVGDMERVVDLMVGLATHGFSITERGSVVCTARMSQGALLLGVEDTGRLLRLEEQALLFDPVDYDEVSIGLLLARAVAEHYGSRISVVTDPVRGNRCDCLLRLE